MEQTHALLKRAENPELPLVALRSITSLRRHLQELELAAIRSARTKGASWDDVASSLGVSRQAIQQRMKHASAALERTADAVNLEPRPEVEV